MSGYRLWGRGYNYSRQHVVRMAELSMEVPEGYEDMHRMESVSEPVRANFGVF